MVPEIQALSPGATLRKIVHTHFSQAVLLPVEDPAILDDLDTLEDLARAQESWTRRAAQSAATGLGVAHA
jgi:CTP:molybdopterin cytidylyltransferase MocA